MTKRDDYWTSAYDALHLNQLGVDKDAFLRDPTRTLRGLHKLKGYPAWVRSMRLSPSKITDELFRGAGVNADQTSQRESGIKEHEAHDAKTRLYHTKPFKLN